MGRTLLGNLPLIHLAISASLGLNLIGCAPSGMSSDDVFSDSRGLTGQIGSNGSPYTIGGDQRAPEVIDRLRPKNPDQPTAQEKATLALAQSIQSFTWSRHTGLEKQRLGGDRLTVRVILKGSAGQTPLEFSALLASGGRGELTQKDLKETSGKRYLLDASFFDQKENAALEGTLTLKQLDERSRVVAEVPVLVRSFSAPVKAIVAEGQQTSDKLRESLKNVDQNAYAWVSNTVIPQGASFYDVQILRPTTPSSAPSQSQVQRRDQDHPTLGGERARPILAPRDRPSVEEPAELLFRFSGPSRRTGMGQNEVAEKIEPGTLPIQSATLIGDAEETDGRTFELKIADGNQPAAEVAVVIEPPRRPSSGLVSRANTPPTAGSSTNSGPSQSSPPSVIIVPSPRAALSATAFLPTREDRTRYPLANKMVQDFSRNADLVPVRQAIAEFTRPGALPILREKFGRISHVRDLIVETFHVYDVAPSAALLTLQESRFFSEPSYPIQVGSSTDTGPFQILLSTGPLLNMNVDRSQTPGRLPSVNDERLYFAPSACGAARHLRNSLDVYHVSDSTLALLAYNLGDQGVVDTTLCRRQGRGSKCMNPMEFARKYQFSFRKIVQERMLPSDRISYVSRTLALHLITSDLKTYGLEVQPSPNTIPQERIFPRQSIKDPLCRGVVEKVITAGSLPGNFG